MCASSVLLSSPGSDSHLYDMPSCLASNLSLSLSSGLLTQNANFCLPQNDELESV